MSRTVVPEQERRASDLTDLADNIYPSDNRVVLVESDFDGASNHFYWDPSGDASNANGEDKVSSNITEFADGGANEGLWRRVRDPNAASLANETTDDLTEGSTNLYYTETRVDNFLDNNGLPIQGGNNISLSYDSGTDTLTISSSGTDLSASTTDDLTEGSTNLYYTDERVQDAVNSLLVGGSNITLSYDDATDSLTIDSTGTDLSTSTTDDLSEGSSNLYYTTSRFNSDFDSYLQNNGITVQGGTNVSVNYDSNNNTLTISSDLSTTDELTEGSTNQFYTQSRFDSDFSSKDTDDLSEGSSNLYYTQKRVRQKLKSDIPNGQQTFSGDGQTKTFQIAHGLSSTPNSWNVTAATDGGSAFSHVTADSTNLTIHYDVAPPSGTDNIVLNWAVFDYAN